MNRWVKEQWRRWDGRDKTMSTVGYGFLAIVMLLCLSGLPFILIRNAPLLAGARDGGIHFFYPSRAYQLGFETLVIVFLYLLLVLALLYLANPPEALTTPPPPPPPLSPSSSSSSSSSQHSHSTGVRALLAAEAQSRINDYVMYLVATSILVILLFAALCVAAHHKTSYPYFILNPFSLLHLHLR